MRNTIKCSIAAAVLALGALQANALQFVNWHNVHLNEGQTANGSFDISPPYNPATEQVLSASVRLHFKDDSYFDLQEYAIVYLGGEFFGQTIVGNQPANFFDIYGSVSGNVIGSAFVGLNATGELDYTVTAWNDGNRWTNRDFIFTKAVLDVEIGQRANVPDGGATIALLGLSLLGASALRRKR